MKPMKYELPHIDNYLHHIVKTMISYTQCGIHSVENCKIFSPTIFCKNSVKLTFSLKSYTVNQFDEKNFQWGKVSEITTLWNLHFAKIMCNQYGYY